MMSTHLVPAARSHPNLVDATHSSRFVSAPHPSQFIHGQETSRHKPVPSQHRRYLSVDDTPDTFHQSSLSCLAAQPEAFGRFNEEWEASQRGSSIIDEHYPVLMEESEIFPGAVVEPVDNAVTSSTTVLPATTVLPSRGGTLKKKASIKRESSFKRSGSRRDSIAGSVRSLKAPLEPERNETQSALYSPVPTSGNPTDVLANRFSAWRKVLKDLITYFREIQSQYDHRSKALLKVTNIINNTTVSSGFMKNGGIDDALSMLRIYHKDAITQSTRASDIENDVILALTGLRSDLSQKIKEIKSLSGDFKNSVDKEMDGSRRAIQGLAEALHSSENDQAAKQDPYLLRMAVDRQVERQIDEENYLHQAYLNLEKSGRELESIVVGEIQKSYNAYAAILKRESDEALMIVEELRNGPIAMPKDTEWNTFVKTDEHFVNPDLPMRSADTIHYPGRDSELAVEVRAGLLERKSKYLKSYTPGWYVLSPTHLHEFKSQDKTQAPIMSLYLPEQKLGSHSDGSGSSNKFMLKGKQAGGMHRGHAWVFRAESHDTMMAWYAAIKTLTESAPHERSAFVRQHARSVSGTSQRANSISSDGALDEEDEEPFSAANSSTVLSGAQPKEKLARPQPGGRFPSDLHLNTQRGLQAPLSPSSESSDFGNQLHDKNVAAAAVLPGSGIGEHYGAIDKSPTHAAELKQMADEDGVNPYNGLPIQHTDSEARPQDGRDLFAAAAAGLGGLGLGAAGTEAYRNHQAEQDPEVVEGRYADRSAQNPGAAPYSTEALRLQEQAAREAEAIAAPDGDSRNLYTPASPSQNAAGFHQQSIAAIEAHSLSTSDQVTDGVHSPDTEAFPAFISGGRSQGELTSIPSPTFSADATAIPAAELIPSPSRGQTFVPLEAEPTPEPGPSTDPLMAEAYPEAAAAGQLTSQNVPSPLDTLSRGYSGTRPPTLGEIVRAGQHHESTSTISNLHVPGEFPKDGKRNAGAVVADLPV